MFSLNEIQSLLSNDKSELMGHVTAALQDRLGPDKVFPGSQIEWETTAGVLMLLGHRPAKTQSRAEPCIVLNKRSLRVRQPGDLCFPGGRVSPRLDPFLARLFALPFASLGRWSHWAHWKKNHRR